MDDFAEKPREDRRRGFMGPKQIALLILLVIIFIIMVQNRQVVSVGLLFWRIELSQLVLILIMLCGGFLAGFLTAKLTGRSRR